jgi:hypothetical protein
MAGGMAGPPKGRGGMSGSGMGGSGMPGAGVMGGRGMMGSGMMGGPGGMGGMGMGGASTNDAIAKMITKRARTDFILQFVWQPTSPPEPIADIEKKIREAENDAKNAGAVRVPTEEEMADASLKAAKKKLEDLQKQPSQPTAPGTPPPAAGTTPPAGGTGTAVK